MISTRRSWGPADLDKVGELRFRCEDWTGLPCPTSLHLTIEQADPVVWCAAEVLKEIQAGQEIEGYPVAIDGDLITFRTANRAVIYRVGEYDQERRAYLLTWPD